MSSSATMTAWGGREPRPWQAEALPIAIRSLRLGLRSLIRAATGSGKSILMAEVISTLMASGLADNERILVTAPTRSLVRQLARTIETRNPECVGRFFTSEKRVDRPVIVACHRSLVKLGKFITKQALSVKWWLVDEAHKTECEEVLGIARDHVSECPRLGFTATPFRSNVKQSLSLFDELIYEYDAQRAIADGVIVPPEIRPYDGGEEDINVVCLAMIRDTLSCGPGIVNATSIRDAESYAQFLTENGIKAEPIHSSLGRSIRQDRQKRLEAAVLDCLVHVNMLSEGVDFPWLRWICLRRGVGSRVRFIQEVGRVLRAYPGKDRGLVLDPRDLFGKLALDYPALIGDQPVGYEEDDECEDEVKGERISAICGGCGAEFLAPPNQCPECDWSPSPEVVFVQGDAVRGYIRQRAQQARNMGLASWRGSISPWGLDQSMSDRQHSATKSLMTKIKRNGRIDGLPEQERPYLLEAWRRGERGDMNRRDASDLITILKAIARSNNWPFGGGE